MYPPNDGDCFVVYKCICFRALSCGVCIAYDERRAAKLQSWKEPCITRVQQSVLCRRLQIVACPQGSLLIIEGHLQKKQTDK